MDTPTRASLLALMSEVIELDGSDLHLNAGSPPIMRLDGRLRRLKYDPLISEEIEAQVSALLTPPQRERFAREHDLDFAYQHRSGCRFRANLYRQRQLVSAVFRLIPREIRTLTQLGIPAIAKTMIARPRGLVLVTGQTGAGKSTTLAAMVDEINRTRAAHIVTIEEPIEFVHADKLGVISQREVGEDTPSFSAALRHVLRQDPDVLLIGEMRDLDTVDAALHAAETGHLVLSTLHTNNAQQSIERIIDFYPAYQHTQVQNQLANVLIGTISQTLLPSLDGQGRLCAAEVMLCNPAVRTLIRDGKFHQIANVIQGSVREGMRTLDDALKGLVLSAKISVEAAMHITADPLVFRTMLNGYVLMPALS